MDKLEPHTSKEAAWRSRLQRHAQSGKSIAAFCREEAVSTASFHIWRTKMAAADGHAVQPAQPAAFIDLGAIKNTGAVRPWRIRRRRHRRRLPRSTSGSISGLALS